MSIEVMKQALEWIEAQPEPRMIGALKTITALRQAIEQAEQAQPVAYSYTSRITGAQGFSHHTMPIDAESWDIKPLYAALPPRQPWVGLTADEIWQCNKAPASHYVEYHISVAHQNVLDFAEAIEAKLKEKNT
jgi:hypothetical protein